MTFPYVQSVLKLRGLLSDLVGDVTGEGTHLLSCFSKFVYDLGHIFRFSCPLPVPLLNFCLF